MEGSQCDLYLSSQVDEGGGREEYRGGNDPRGVYLLSKIAHMGRFGVKGRCMRFCI